MRETYFLEFISLAFGSFFLVGFLTPIMRNIAIKRDVLDLPSSPHKSHVIPVPYMGGVAIMAGILAVTYFALFFGGRPAGELFIATSVLLPAAALGLVGLIDDIRNMQPLPKFVAQTIAGTFTAFFLIATDSAGNPSGNQFLDAAMTLMWVVGITNSINFFDNLDGGASGAVAISSFALFLIAASNGQFLIAGLSIVTFGALLGFLLWNKSPARIYMGDAGALFLGVLVSVLALRLDPEVDSKITSFAIPVLLLAVPILDTSVAVISRVLRGVSPFQGGQDHLSHRLMKRGFSKRQSAYLLWSLTAIFAGVAVSIAILGGSSFLLLLLAIMFWVGLFTIFIRA